PTWLQLNAGSRWGAARGPRGNLIPATIHFSAPRIGSSPPPCRRTLLTHAIPGAKLICSLYRLHLENYMEFVSLRDLKINPSKVMGRLSKGDMIVTRNGKPAAALVYL